MPVLCQLRGQAVHPRIKELLDEQALDFSDISSIPDFVNDARDVVGHLTRPQACFLADAALQRVLMSNFAGFARDEEFAIKCDDILAAKWQTTSLTDGAAIQAVLDRFQEFYADPEAVFIVLRSGVIEVNPILRNAEYLCLAKIILFDDFDPQTGPEALLWGQFLFTYASLLVDCCPLVRNKISELASISQDSYPLELRVKLNLVLANAYLYFYDCQHAIEIFDAAKHLCGVDFDFFGELGKRTYFQVNDLPQLFAKATIDGSVDQNAFSKIPESDGGIVPEALVLEDDTLMPETKRAKSDPTDGDRGEVLFPAHLACMATALVIMQRSEPHDELLYERVDAFVTELLSHRPVYGVQMRCLLARCMNEAGRKRRIERALMQAEALQQDLRGIHGPKGADLHLPFSTYRQRLPWLLESGGKPFWAYMTSYASILLSISSYGEAVEVYRTTCNFNALIECLVSIGQGSSAESVVRNLLAVKRTPYRLCLMGDITHDDKWYTEAIELSGDRSAQARTAKGIQAMKQGNFTVAYDNLKRAVEIKPLQTSTLFALGHVAYKLEKYADAVAAYRSCINVEPQEYEAWNNLSASFVHLNRPDQAQRTMKEALKFNSGHAEMWKNYAIMSINAADYSQAAYAIRQHIAMAKNIEVREIVQKLLVSALQIRKNMDPDAWRLLRRDIVELMSVVAAKTIMDADTSFCYAVFLKPDSRCVNVDEWRFFVDVANKATLQMMNRTPWKTEDECMTNVVQSCLEIFDAHKRIADLLPPGESKMPSTHLTRIKGVLRVAQSNYGGDFGFAPDQLRVLLENTRQIVG